MLCGLVMAGGKGERFWPLSTEQKPKQFLKLLGEATMLQMTVKRIEKLIPIERIFIVTAKNYVSIVKEQIPHIPYRNIIIEPVGKNTAPCIALSAFTIERYIKDSTLVVVPSDQLVENEERFIDAIKAAEEFVKNKRTSIVTLGIKPNRPEIGYGYIKFDIRKLELDKFNIHSVICFVEKPDEKKANEYLQDGNYLWNSGIFVWKVSTIKELVKAFLPGTYEAMLEIAVSIDKRNFDEVLQLKYSKVESISVDYGIMERAENIYVIPVDFGWDDVGTWNSLERYREKDKSNNVIVGDVINVDCKNNIVFINGRKTILIGIDDMFVIDSGEVLVIGKRDKLYDIKKIKDYLISNKEG